MTFFGRNECRKSRSFFHEVVAFVSGIFLVLAFVWAQNSTAQVSAASSVSQGQKNIAQKESRWSGSAQWSLQKNQDYYSDYYTALTLGAAYKINKNFTGYAEAGYSQPVSDNEEKVKYYGFEDVELGVSTAPFYKNKYNFQVSATTSVALPTSETSQKSSLNASWSGGLLTATPLQKGFRVSTIHIVTLNSYTYETSNTMGTSYNYPYAFTNGITGSWSYKSFYSALSTSLTHIKNYANTEINIQSFRASLGYGFTNSLRSEIFGRWSDRTLTNNSAFDDDRTYYGMLLTISI